MWSGTDEVYIRPAVQKQAESASTSDLITYYSPPEAVPAKLWASPIEKARDHVGILV